MIEDDQEYIEIQEQLLQIDRKISRIVKTNDEFTQIVLGPYRARVIPETKEDEIELEEGSLTPIIKSAIEVLKQYTKTLEELNIKRNELLDQLSEYDDEDVWGEDEEDIIVEE